MIKATKENVNLKFYLNANSYVHHTVNATDISLYIFIVHLITYNKMNNNQ